VIVLPAASRIQSSYNKIREILWVTLPVYYYLGCIPFSAMSGLFIINDMKVTTHRARNTKAKRKKNHASRELGIMNPHAGLSLGM
jgi:hypothetical protein